MKKISSICLNVTDDCCLKCKYCFVQQQKNYMSYDIAKKSIDWLINENKDNETTPSISFFGGEPLLTWDSIIKPLTLYIRENLQRNDISLSITTNGILLDKEKLDFFKKYNIPILLSMDGDKITQDINRPLKNQQKNSSFDILNSKIDMLLDYFPETTFRGTITPETAKYYSNNLNYAFKKGFKNCFFIVNTHEFWNEQSKNDLTNEVRIYSDFLIKSFIYNTPIIRQNALEQMFNRIILNNILILQNIDSRKNFDINQSACGSGVNGHAAIDYQGTIYSCQELVTQTTNPLFIIGNIFDGINPKKVKTLSQFLNKPKNIKSSMCKDCLVESTCNINACRIENYLLNNNPYEQHEISCWWQNLLAKEVIYICNFLGSLKNEPFKEYLKYILSTNSGCFI